jgi:hypothetical protein
VPKVVVRRAKKAANRFPTPSKLKDRYYVCVKAIVADRSYPVTHSGIASLRKWERVRRIETAFISPHPSRHARSGLCSRPLFT